LEGRYCNCSDHASRDQPQLNQFLCHSTKIMTATYWEIGRRIVEQEQHGRKRASYGEALIERLSSELTVRFGRGFSRRNLWQMRDFYSAWPILPAGSRSGLLDSHRC
jgi:hypothetical protein